MDGVGEKRPGELRRIEYDIQLGLQEVCLEQTAVTYECMCVVLTHRPALVASKECDRWG